MNSNLKIKKYPPHKMRIVLKEAHLECRHKKMRNDRCLEGLFSGFSFFDILYYLFFYYGRRIEYDIRSYVFGVINKKTVKKILLF